MPVLFVSHCVYATSMNSKHVGEFVYRALSHSLFWCLQLWAHCWMRLLSVSLWVSLFSVVLFVSFQLLPFFPSSLFLLFCFCYFNLVPAPLVNKWSSVYKVKDVPLHWHDWLCYWTLSALTEPLRTDVFSVFIDKKKTNHRCLLNAHICAEALAEM